MSITSFYFLCLFALALLLYYLIPKKVQWPLLLLLSIGYFLTSAEVRDSHAWYLILYPMAAVGAVWGAAILIDRTKEQKKKLAALICAVLFCVGLLCTLKFFHLGLLAPMGISFYTLTLLGYLFDVYYEIGPVQRNYGKLLLLLLPDDDFRPDHEIQRHGKTDVYRTQAGLPECDVRHAADAPGIFQKTGHFRADGDPGK